MKVVCDTNVLVSGILFPGNPRAVLQLVSKGQIAGSISLPILSELEGVLLRPKFGLSLQQVSAILELVQQTFHLVSPVKQVEAVSADPDDNAIIEAALGAQASVIISGDGHLLSLGVYRGVRIVSPADFLAEWSGQRAPGGE